ncbi:MAG TPA: efflux RND transporter periplasmic adaptor subunit [Gammaproteobacteria bacterium]|nr:efflux RND transporter periplasmic adaptor subunit [Gammaproteobacteria bacterium]
MLRRLLATAAIAALGGYLLGRQIPNVPVANPAPAHVHNAAKISLARDATKQLYVCPMHHEITSDSPDHCPICGMALVKAETIADTDIGQSGSPVVRITPNVVEELGVRTAKAQFGEMFRNIETIGKITRVDPTARRILSPPISGQLIYVAKKIEGDPVVQGELLFSVSSPELLRVENEFQQAARLGGRAMATSMIPRLRDMGLSPEQIAQLQTGKASALPVEVYSVEDGIVFAQRGKVGDEIPSGFTVFNLSGQGQVIDVTAEIFERQWSWIQQGQDATVEVRDLPGTTFHGKVTRVEPPVGYTTRSLEAHIEFRSNNSGFNQAMFAHVVIHGQPRHNVLMVPADAVIRTSEGDRIIAVRPDGSFQPLTVSTGEESAGTVEILSGIQAGVPVVVSGQFLIDSESSVLADLRRMRRSARHLPFHGPTIQAAHPGAIPDAKVLGTTDQNSIPATTQRPQADRS